ncbi:hypothetical protein [Pseudarthrobacter albicanus]|uniref:hypothetical protein n=1 Tax=Pseudarthrobacter albicanus TaxID=2823873 RepID=UPI001BAADCA1|nr:hypothetical protein [Pseudarthrobacter albicanus]
MVLTYVLGTAMGLNNTATFMSSCVAFVAVSLWTDSRITRLRRRTARGTAREATRETPRDAARGPEADRAAEHTAEHRPYRDPS